MVSNLDDKYFKNVMPEGKRHYQSQKKTSLYGSESPKDERSRTYKPRNGNNIFGVGEEVFINHSSKNCTSDQEKRDTIEELKRYNPWGKPGAGAPNVNNSNNSNRAKWEYEQELKAREANNDNASDSFPGFNSSFGTGKTTNNSRRRSDMSQNNNSQQDNYFPFGSPGGGAPIVRSNAQGATVTVHKNQEQGDIMYKKYEETKALADDLEEKIQKLKLKQMEEKYASMKNDKDQDYGYQDEQDTGDKSNLSYGDDALFRAAENRARLRELDRMKESYDQDYSENESNFTNDSENHDRSHPNGNGLMNENFSSVGQRPQNNNKKDSFTINRNDYRPYTVEEYINCRPQIINPSLNKRTTLSGSEERRSNHNYNNKSPAGYQTKAPYATD